MLVGHYSAALLAKAASPRLPLWLLVLAVQLVDFAHALLVLAGVERVRFDTSLPSNPVDLTFIPFSHGLPSTILLGVAVFCGARKWLGETKPALALALAAASHWILDLLVHRPDLPLWGNSFRVGLALWNHPALAFLLELGLLLGCGAILARSGVLQRTRRTVFVGFLAVLLVVLVVSFLGTVPPSPRALAGTLLVFLLAAAWLASRVERKAQRGRAGHGE